MAPFWIDTHCHLDACEFDADRDAVLARARAAGVGLQVLPAVAVSNFDAVRHLAHTHGLAYALGIHPLCVDRSSDDDLDRLAEALARHRDAPRLVAVGEIGLDHFVPGLDLVRAERFYLAQLKLARDTGLPVLLHVRRSADSLLKGLRLGFGGAMTFDRALQIRRLAAAVPAHSLVLETDAPDIPPHWLYRTAAQRAAGGHSRNQPSELPRIAAVLADLRGWALDETAAITTANAQAALPRLAALTPGLSGSSG